MKTGKPRKRFFWLWKTVQVFLLIVALCLVLDFGYSLKVGSNMVRWESGVQRNREGVRQGCEAYTVAGDPGTALLLIHGINESPHAFQKAAPFLARQGVHCRCMRLAGFGESVEAYQKADVADWLASVDREVVTLLKSHQRVVLLGHSLGGAIAIQYTLKNPGRVAGLVLVAPAIDVASSRSPLFPVRFWNELLGKILVFTDTVESPFGADVLDPKVEESGLRTPFTPVKVIDQTFELIEMNRNRAQDLKLPVLVITASQDKVVDNEAAGDFFSAIPAAKKKHVVLSNSAHAVLVDFQWKAACQHVIRFLESLPSVR